MGHQNTSNKEHHVDNRRGASNNIIVERIAGSRVVHPVPICYIQTLC
jgi:hypothetical protein